MNLVKKEPCYEEGNEVKLNIETDLAKSDFYENPCYISYEKRKEMDESGISIKKEAGVINTDIKKEGGVINNDIKKEDGVINTDIKKEGGVINNDIKKEGGVINSGFKKEAELYPGESKIFKDFYSSFWPGGLLKQQRKQINKKEL